MSKGRGNGTKKYGRNLKKCARYKLEDRQEKNKARKAARYDKHIAKLKSRNKGEA